MADAARRRATYEDLLAVPEHLIAEIIDGELLTQARPASLHSLAATVLTTQLGGPFQHGRNGPGGWVILFEPELHVGGDVLVPDLAGWRRERMPEIPDVSGFVLAPDWVCEVLSPSTEAIDRARKTRVYARENVGFLWLVNPATQTLEVLELDGETYRIAGVFEGAAKVRGVPFDALELELGALWAR